MATVQNQRIIHVHREKANKNFIQLNKYNFTKAYRDMSNTPAALGLYIWLVGNKDGYTFEFSPQSIENQLGMAKTSCQGAFKKLVELGYLVQRNENSNQFDFYEVTILDGKTDRRRLVSEEMINFDELTEESGNKEIETHFPLAKPGKFEF